MCRWLSLSAPAALTPTSWPANNPAGKSWPCRATGSLPKAVETNDQALADRGRSDRSLSRTSPAPWTPQPAPRRPERLLDKESVTEMTEETAAALQTAADRLHVDNVRCIAELQELADQVALGYEVSIETVDRAYMAFLDGLVAEQEIRKIINQGE